MGINPEHIRSISISMLEICVFYITCYNLFTQNDKMNQLLKYFLSALIGIVTLGVSLKWNGHFVKYLLIPFFLSVMMNLLFYHKKKKKIHSLISISLVIIVVYGFMFLSDYIILLGIKLVDNGSIYELIMGDKESVFLLIVISKTIVLFAILFFTRDKRNSLQFTSKQSFQFILLSMLTIVGIFSSFIPEEHMVFSPKLIVPGIFISNALFMYYMLYDFINLSEDLRIKSIREVKSANEIKLWKEISDRDLVQRKMLHDYSETLLCIRTYLENDRLEELKNFVARLSADYKLSASVIRTGNMLFDVLVNTKYEMALSQNINLVLKLDNLEEIGPEDEDFIFLMSNLIDNAMEHTAALKTVKKEIFLTVTNVRKYNKLEIVIRNPIETEIIVEDYRIPTSKKGGNHGLGLLTIRDIIEKYNGESEIYVDDGYFTYIITI